MSGFAEIAEALRAACGAGPGLRSRVERAGALAADLVGRADSHGWVGVAASMRGAADALESAVVELVEVQRASEAALGELDVIDDQGSVEQVSVHLVGAQRELAIAVQKIDAVTASVDVALQACAQAGQRGLPTALSAVREDVIETRGRLEESRNACDAERLSAEAWLQENPDQGTASNPATGASMTQSGAGLAAIPARPPVRETSSPPASLDAARVTFDQLLDPSDRTLLPREAESGGSQLRPEEEEDARRASGRNAAPEAGLTRRTRRFLALTATGTLLAQATIGAVLEFGSAMGQAIGTVVFGAAALLIEGPEIAKTLRETRRKRSTEPGVRKRAHGK